MRNIRILAAAGMIASSFGPALAQDLPSQSFKVVGIASSIPVAIYDEAPFWREELPKASGGKITAELTPLDQMGVDPASMLRLLRLGVMDFAGIDITTMASDDATFEGCDLAGITTDADLAREACDSYRDVLRGRLAANWNAELLAIGASTPQVFWCRDDVDEISDLAGKKIRVFNNTLRDFVEGLGATSVSIAFSEVVPALNNGVVDCAVTGTLSGNTAGWPEIAKSVFMLPIAWSFNAVVVNKQKWDGFDENTRTFMTTQMEQYEDRMWDTLKRSIEDANACNVGGDGCTLGRKAKIKLNYPSAEDLAKVAEIVQSKVLPNWASRCGGNCMSEWEATIGQVVGLQAGQ